MSADNKDKSPVNQAVEDRLENVNQSSDRVSRAESADSDRSSPAPVGAVSNSAANKKARRRDERGLDQVMKSLSNIESLEERLTVLGRKYTELLDEHRNTQSQLKNNQRSLQLITREKDQLQSDHGKVVLAKSKLESLCRELQRHNKLVKDESLARAKEDDEKRKEITTRFQTTITDIQQQMTEHYEKNSSLREENLDLANKLKGLIEQYELREKQIDKVIETKEVETKLYDARLQQAALQITEEKEKHLQDKQILMKEVLESQQKLLLMDEQEKALRAQVKMYTEKYDEFQTTLTKSNDVFTNFKSEMDKMTKKMRKLEKDTVTWKQKWESGQRALIEMAEQKASGDKTITLLQNKVSKLESLCRALQEERKLYTAAAATATAAASLQAAAASSDSSATPPESSAAASDSSTSLPESSAADISPADCTAAKSFTAAASSNIDNTSNTLADSPVVVADNPAFTADSPAVSADSPAVSADSPTADSPAAVV